MIDERRESQACFYALGALPLAEAQEFEQTMRTDLELQLLVTELRAAADSLPASFLRVDPPPALKTKILGAVGGGGWTPVNIVLWPGALPMWLPWAVAACFALLCVLLITSGRSLREQTAQLKWQLEETTRRNDELQHQGNELQSTLAANFTNYQQRLSDLQKQITQTTADSQRERAARETQFVQKAGETQRQLTVAQQQLAQKNAELGRLQELAGANFGVPDNFTELRVGALKPTPDGPAKASAVTVWDAQRQKGILVVDSLVPLTPEQTYQLWLFDPRFATPVSGGVFNVDPRGSGRLQFLAGVRVDTVDRFAISVERRGGVAVPQGKVVLAGN